MNNQLPIQRESNIFIRFINFFRKKKINKKNATVTGENSTINESKDVTLSSNLNLNFTHEKNDIQKKQEALHDIIKIVEKNPDILYKLDIQKLNIINNYYDEKIIKLEKRLAKLKRTI